MKPKVLVLGATGQLGSRVYNTAKETGKYNLGVLVRDKKKAYNSGTRIFHGDLLDKSSFSTAIEWADVVVNCSGMVSYHKKDKELLFNINRKGVDNILENCLKFGKSLIHTSSAAIYGYIPYPIEAREGDLHPETVYKSGSAYYISKLQSDIDVSSAALNKIILRPSVLLSDSSRTLNSLLGVLKKGIYPGIRGGASFADINAVADAYIVCIDKLLKEKHSGIYNLGGSNYTFRQIINRMIALLGIKPIVRVPAFALSSVGFINDLFSLNSLSAESIKISNNFSYVDSSKAVRGLKYNIIPVEEILHAIYAD